MLARGADERALAKQRAQPNPVLATERGAAGRRERSPQHAGGADSARQPLWGGRAGVAAGGTPSRLFRRRAPGGEEEGGEGAEPFARAKHLREIWGDMGETREIWGDMSQNTCAAASDAALPSHPPARYRVSSGRVT